METAAIYNCMFCRTHCMIKKPPKNCRLSAKSLIFRTKTNEIFTNLYSDKTRFKAQHEHPTSTWHRYATRSSSDLSKLLLVAKVTRLRSIVLRVHTWQLQPRKDFMDEAVMLSMRWMYRTHIQSKASVCADDHAQHAAWHFSVMSSYNTRAFCVYMHVVKTKDIYLSVPTSWLYSLDFIMHHGFSKYFTMTLSLQGTKIRV